MRVKGNRNELTDRVTTITLLPDTAVEELFLTKFLDHVQGNVEHSMVLERPGAPAHQLNFYPTFEHET